MLKTVRSGCNAKINLFLDIVGEENGYHNLDSVVVTINLKDRVIIKERKDKQVTLKCDGMESVDAEKNNAYKAGKRFMEEFGTNGVDIALKKEIPVGSGLGGSSADIVAVLKGMKKLYKIEADLKPIADSLGSDCGYLLTGGYARISGRGEIVEPLNIDANLNVLLVIPQSGVNTADCFKTFDAQPTKPVVGGAERVINALIGGHFEKNDLYNCLYAPATKLNSELHSAYEELAKLSPMALSMSGSGSAVFAIFETVELCEWALTKFWNKPYKTIIVKTLSKKQLEQKPWFLRSIYD